MPDTTGAGSDKPADANAGDTANASSSDIDARINRIITARLERQAKQFDQRFDQIAQLLEKTVAQPKDAASGKQETAAGDSATGDRLSLKALQEQIAKLSQGVQERDKKIQEAEQRTRELRVRSEVQTHFAKHLGADSPHIGPYVNHFLGQFADQEGATMRKVKNEFGEDSYIPAAQAIEELFKSDLKHLVQQSKAASLPRSTFGQANGNPFAPPTQATQGQQSGQTTNPFAQAIAGHYASMGEYDKANQFANALQAPPPAPKK